MKVLFLVFALCVVGSLSLPVAEKEEGKWEKIKEEAIAIKNVVSNTVDEIKELVHGADREKVETVLDAAKVEADAIFDEIKEDIKNKDLSVAKIAAYIRKLHELLEKTKAELKEPLAKYVNEIKAKIAEAAKSVGSHIKNIVKLFFGVQIDFELNDIRDEIYEALLPTVTKLFKTVEAAYTDMMNMVEETDADLHKEVTYIVEGTFVKLQDMAMRVTRDVESGHMSGEKMDEYLTELGAVYVETKDALVAVISKFPELFEKVKAKFETTMPVVLDLIQDIMEILKKKPNGGNISLLAKDYSAIIKEFEAMKMVAHEAAMKIITLAKETNEEVGNKIEVILKHILEQLEPMVEEVKQLIKTETLTPEKALEIVQKVTEILHNAKHELKEQMDRLPPTLVAEMMAIAQNAKVEAMKHAFVIYKLIKDL